MRRRKNLLQRLAKIVNVALMACTFVLVWEMLYEAPMRVEALLQTKLLLLMMCLSVYVWIGRIYDAFLLDVDHIHYMIYSQMLAAGITDCISYILIWMVMGSAPNLLGFLVAIPLQFLVSTVWSCVAHQWYSRNFPPRRALFVANNPQDAYDLARNRGFSEKFMLVSVLSTAQMLQMPEEELREIDVIFLLETERAWAVMQRCAMYGIRIYRVPLVSEIIASRSATVMLFNTPMLRMDGYKPAMYYVVMKRLMDLLLVGCSMPIVLPIMLVVAVAIKLDDGGPVFYRQERLTKGGKHFYILKFRSMRVNAESDGVARLSTGVNDDRITRVGRVIRALRLDELPQLLNILKGDMSIVGPRPERPELAEQYTRSFPEFQLRLLAKAGLTGYAQVCGKYNSTPEDKLRMDLMYILRPSVKEDLRILLATVKILFMAESTEGVAEGQTNAMKNSSEKSEEGKIAS